MATNSSKLNKAREMLIEEFTKCLDEDKLPWSKGWNSVGVLEVHNPVSKTKYKGVNAFLLTIMSYHLGYDDPRWCTLNQAGAQGWKIKKGSKSLPVEFWSVYDKVNKKKVTLHEYSRLINNEERDPKDFSVMARTYNVFNAAQIEGIPEFERPELPKVSDVEMDQFIDNIIVNMKVGFEERGNQPFYSPLEDTVVIPKKEQFVSQHEYDATLLHELAHATGHSSRLDRDLSGTFGSKDYAVEELRAEISSVFMSQYIDLDISQMNLDNHKAYVQSWGEQLKEDPNILFRAIKDAERISEYMAEKGEMNRLLGMEEQQKEIHADISERDNAAPELVPDLPQGQGSRRLDALIANANAKRVSMETNSAQNKELTAMRE